MQVDGDRATAKVSLTATLANGNTLNRAATFDYVKEDGWRVCLR